MGTLYLIRHGQASFGADNYDLLSPLGRQQSVRLGEYFRYKGLHFEAALSGTLTRQVQTLEGICAGMGVQFESSAASKTQAAGVVGSGRRAGPPQARPAPPGGSAVREATSVGAHILWPGLNEYDSAAVIAAIHPQPLEKPTTPELYKHHFRLLKDGLAQWMAGVVSPRGMPDYDDFVLGVTSALAHVRSHYRGNVLLVSSGGPIATAVGQVLGTSPETTIELNMQIRNSSVTEFAFNARRHRMVSFNSLAHLDAPEHAGWVTYA
ncbi:MAG: histidine phosphatase family protein [Polaromonas sp.]